MDITKRIVQVLYHDFNHIDTRYTPIIDGSFTLPKKDTLALDNIFSNLNQISGTAAQPTVKVTIGAETFNKQSSDFMEAGHTSMSVGDIVILDGAIYVADFVGWKRVRVGIKPELVDAT